MNILKIKNQYGVWVEIPAVIGPSAYQVAVQNGYEGTEEEWLESLHGKDYILTEADRAEIVGEVQTEAVDGIAGALNAFFTQFGMANGLKNSFISQYRDTRIDLKKGAMYYFEVADTSKAYIYKADGSQASTLGAVAALLIIPEDNDSYAKFLAIEKIPSVSSLSDVLSLINSIDEVFGSVRIPTAYLDGGYLSATNNESIWCWEIGAKHDTSYGIGTYSMKSLVAGITAELKLSLAYGFEYDEYAIYIGENEVYRADAGKAVRVASEILGAEDTRIVFFEGGEEVLKARTKPTIKNCGILYVESE